MNMIGLDYNQQTRYEIFSVFRNLMSISLRGYIELSANMSNGKPTIYYGVHNKYKIKIGFNLWPKTSQNNPSPTSSISLPETNYMRLDTIKWNDHTFKQLSKEAKLIYCFLEAHCSTAGFLQADESDIANGIGLERRSGLNPFGNVVVLAMEELEDSDFIVQGDHDFILILRTHKKQAHGKLKVSNKAKDYYRVGILKSGMHTAVLTDINSTCECFSKEVILEEFEAYFEVLEREVFHELLRWGGTVWFLR